MSAPESKITRQAAVQAMEVPGEARTITVVNRLPPGEVGRAGLLLLGIAIGAYGLWVLRELIFLLLLGVMVATAIEPLVHGVRQRVRVLSTGAGVLIVYATILAAIGLPVYLLVPTLLAQVDQFSAGLPGHVEKLRTEVQSLEPAALRDTSLSVLTYAQSALRPPEAPRPEEVAETGTRLLDTAVRVVTVFIVAFYWLLERDHIRRALGSAVPERARAINLVWIETEKKLGGWVRGQLLLMLLVGLAAGIGYTVIGLPSPILLAVLAAAGELIPIIGPILGFAPAVIVALVVSPGTALITLVFALVVQQIEGYVLVPRIMSKTVGISPLTVIVGIMGGAALFGLPGAILAVPVAGAIQVLLVRALGLEQLHEGDPPDEATLLRDAKARSLDVSG